MSPVTREQLLDGLQAGWGTYVQRFNDLSPDQQTTYLQQQGYACFGDLLAHVTAWWSDGQQSISTLLVRPDTPPKEYDVDAFNARAVAQSQGLSEPELILRFDETRAAMQKVVDDLPEEAMQNPRINKRLSVEIIGHLEEHALPGKM
jgi:hypothetical protein